MSVIQPNARQATRTDRRRGAALVEYVLVFPLVILLFFGALEVFRLLSVKQSLRSGVKQAVPYFSHWKDYAYQDRGSWEEKIRHELRRNPLVMDANPPLSISPTAGQLNALPEGATIVVTVEVKVPPKFVYALFSNSRIPIRETVVTFIDSSPEYFELNVQTPFPRDPAVLP
jgi:hypothetical protein